MIILFLLVSIIIFLLTSAVLDLKMMYMIYRNNLTFDTKGTSFSPEHYSPSWLPYLVSIGTILIWMVIFWLLWNGKLIIGSSKIFVPVIWTTCFLIMTISRVNRGYYAYYNQFDPRITNTGIYRILRHPQYFSYSVIILTMPIILGNIGFTFYPFILLYFLLGKNEDRLLRERF